MRSIEHPKKHKSHVLIQEKGYSCLSKEHLVCNQLGRLVSFKTFLKETSQRVKPKVKQPSTGEAKYVIPAASQYRDSIPEIGDDLNIQPRDWNVSDKKKRNVKKFIAAPIGARFNSDFYFAFGDVDPVIVSPPMIFDLDEHPEGSGMIRLVRLVSVGTTTRQVQITYANLPKSIMDPDFEGKTLAAATDDFDQFLDLLNATQTLFHMKDGRYRKRTFEFDFDGGNQTVEIDMESPEPEMNAPLQMVIPLDFNNRLEIKR